MPESEYELSTLRGVGYRVVESQSQVATLDLVDSLDEQRLLEELLDASKPSSLPRGVHYLIATPFRYPPLRYGSRYGTTDQRGIFYGSEELNTALAETAFYALLFVDHSDGLDALSVMKTAFGFRYETRRAIDTSAPAFDDQRDAIDSPDDYSVTHTIGRAARAQGVEAIRFRSVRCPVSGANLAVLSLEALAPQPTSMAHWQMALRFERVDFLERDRFEPASLSFAAEEFRERGVFTHPSRR